MARKRKGANPDDAKPIKQVYVSGPVDRVYLTPEEEADPANPGVERGGEIMISRDQAALMSLYGYTFREADAPAPEPPPPAHDPVFNPSLVPDGGSDSPTA